MALSFEECTLAKLEKQFGLKEMMEHAVLQEWAAGTTEMSDFERQTLLYLKATLKVNVHDWNEAELAHYFKWLTIHLWSAL